MVEEVAFIIDASENGYPLTQPHITLTIPDYLCKDFLGIMALDVLHDAKGYGYLVGHKLSQLTDLLAESIILNNQNIFVDRKKIQDYVFTRVLSYFMEFWRDNIGALGLSTNPDNTVPIETLRNIVQIPIRRVADRDDEDTFSSLGKNKNGIEAQNYYEQREKLTRECAETMSFVSPKGIRKPSDYFCQASGIVDIIRQRTKSQSKIVLDMKSAAGLIRTLTDPIGYITGLPTYADPGYNMPGMSAIRQHAEIAFINESQCDGHYTGPTEFKYCIQLDTPLCDIPLILLDVTYFYGVSKDGLDRSNVLVSILGETFNNTLPRSMMMAESLGKYLRPAIQEHTLTIADTLSTVKDLILDYYDVCCDPLPSAQTTQNIYTMLHQGLPLPIDSFEAVLHEWCLEDNTVFRACYILNTLQNLEYFNVSNYLSNTNESLLPDQMITSTLPTIMYEYLTGVQDINLLAFSYHQLILLEQYIGHPNVNGVTYQQELADLLSKQWIPKRKGKLLTQINKQVGEWRKKQALQLESMSESITTYLQQLIAVCSQNLNKIVDMELDGVEQKESLLQLLPDFQPSILLEQVLTAHLHFYSPQIYIRTAGVVRTGLLLATLLDTILWYKPLLQVKLDLQTLLTATVHPAEETYHYDHNVYDALRSVTGKFSGDFGQIMWCICYGHIFASEDNNTSAMALMLHRLPKQYINVHAEHKRWGNIHGLGDGSCVDVTIDK